MTQSFVFKRFQSNFSTNQSENEVSTYIMGMQLKLLKYTGEIDDNCMIPVQWSQIMSYGRSTPIVHFNKRREGGKQIYTYFQNRIQEIAENNSIIIKMVGITLNEINEKLDRGMFFNDSQKNAADKC